MNSSAKRDIEELSRDRIETYNSAVQKIEEPIFDKFFLVYFIAIILFILLIINLI